MILNGEPVLPTWDRCFIVEGMTITGIPFPHERIEIDDNMVLKRAEATPERCVAHIRIETKEGEELFVSESNKAAKQRILDFVSTYALKTHHEPTIQDAGGSTMRESNRLGDAKGGFVRATVVYPEEDKKELTKRESDLLAGAIDYFKSNEKIFIDNSWLRNALRYFYFATTNERHEDKLISMIVSLESLFFGKEERGELRYRLSLRTATLIGSMYNDKTTEEVFDDIKKLYDKRCAVIHGGATKVTYDDVYKLRIYTKQAIETFVSMLHIKTKRDILQLLDHCLVSKESADELREAKAENE